MDDLVQWLRAQLDGDERAAEAASPGPWHVNAESDEVLAVDGITVADGFALSSRQLRATTEHIARHDPARVLREIEIDRELLAEYERTLRSHEGHQRESARLAGSGDDDVFRRNALRREADYLPAMLHILERWAKRKAAVYSDRPGYQESWRP